MSSFYYIFIAIIFAFSASIINAQDRPKVDFLATSDYKSAIRTLQEGKKDSAVYYFLETLKKNQNIYKNADYYQVCFQLGALYYDLLDYENAVVFLEIATRYFLEMQDYKNFVKSSNLLGLSYMGMNKEVLSRRYFIRSIDANKKFLQDTTLSIANNTLIIQYLRSKGENNKALKLANSNINLATSIQQPQLIVSNLVLAANSNFNLKNSEQAASQLLEAEKLSISNNKLKDLPEIYELLTKIAIGNGDTAQTLAYLNKYTKALNRVNNLEIYKSSKEISEKYNSENKDNTIKFLENQNAIKTFTSQKQRATIIFLLAGILLVALIVYLAFRNYKNRITNSQIINKQQAELNEQKLTQAQQDNQIIAMESMLLGQEEERNRIGKELHDSLGAMLSTIKLHMGTIQTVEKNGSPNNLVKTKELLDDACEEVRKISRDMMPITLSSYGLNVALEELFDKFSSESGPQVTFQVYGMYRIANKETELYIYRIIQELLNNAIKHANANEILIQINYLDEKMVITVEDDGAGFDYDPNKYAGMGIKNIIYRIKYLKGDLTVDSSKGNGTTTVIEIPNTTLSRENRANSMTLNKF